MKNSVVLGKNIYEMRYFVDMFVFFVPNQIYKGFAVRDIPLIIKLPCGRNRREAEPDSMKS